MPGICGYIKDISSETTYLPGSSGAATSCRGTPVAVATLTLGVSVAGQFFRSERLKGMQSENKKYFFLVSQHVWNSCIKLEPLSWKKCMLNEPPCSVAATVGIGCR